MEEKKEQKELTADDKVFLKELKKMNTLETIGYKTLKEKWAENNKFDDIEFIETTIRRTKHRAIFIPYNGTKHCILVTDAYMECLRNLITVRGIFQMLNRKQLDWFADFYEAFGPKFVNMVEGPPMFIDVNDANAIRTNYKSLLNWKNINWSYRNELRKVINVNSIGDRGFNRKGLVDEIQRLNLDRLFPDIAVYAEKVLKDIKEGKDKLTTTDMYDALEHCQLLALFKKFPGRFDWIRKQGCHFPFKVVEDEQLFKFLEYLWFLQMFSSYDF